MVHRKFKRRLATAKTKFVKGAKPIGSRLLKRTAPKRHFGPRYKGGTHYGSKMVVRQEGLGQVTENRCVVSSGRIDSRARIIKAVATSSNYQKTVAKEMISTQAGYQLWSVIPFATQSELQNINSFIGNANGVNYGQPARFLLEHAHMAYEFQNRSSAPCTLRLYVIRPKRDTWYSTTSPMTFTASNGNSYPWSGFADSAIQQGYNAQVNSASGSTDYLNPAVAPTQVDLFNKYYKIDKEIEVEMAQGGVHRFELHRSYGKVMDGSVYGNTPLTAVAGVTGILLIRAIGSPVTDTQAGANSPVTLSPPNIGIVTTTSYRFTQVSSPIIASEDVNLIGEATGDSLQTVNPGSGNVASVQTA
nr:MAG: capsid protein [Cressdnaviricota sp.]